MNSYDGARVANVRDGNACDGAPLHVAIDMHLSTARRRLSHRTTGTRSLYSTMRSAEIGRTPASWRSTLFSASVEGKCRRL
jgi:hypothetical protein